MHKALFVFIASAVIFCMNAQAADEASAPKETIKISQTDTDAVIFKKHLKLCKIQSPLNMEARQKILAAQSLISTYNSVIHAVTAGNSNSITYETRRMADNLRNQKNSLGYKTRKINNLEKELSTLKTDKVKQAEAAKLETEHKEVLAEIKKINQPFISKKNEYLNKIKAVEQNTELTALLCPLVTAATDINGQKVTSKFFSTSFSTAFASNNWYVNNKRIAYAHIQITSPPGKTGKMKKLAGKYPIQSANNNSMSFWVGKYRIYLCSDDKQYKVEELARKLLNLQGLERSSDSKVVKNCLDVYEYLKQLGQDQQKATQKLNNQNWKLRGKISALKNLGYQPPETVAGMKSELSREKAELAAAQNIIAVSAELQKILKSPASERQKAVPELERKVAELKQQVIDECIKLKAKKAEIISPAEFDIANAKYQALIKKLVHMPDSKLAAVNKLTTVAWFSSPQASISWNLDLPVENRHSYIEIFRGTIQPHTHQVGLDGMIDNKYVIYSHSDSAIIVGVGPMVVTLFSASPMSSGKDLLLKAVKELYDLDAIAELSK
jgi:hypothetical protein